MKVTLALIALLVVTAFAGCGRVPTPDLSFLSRDQPDTPLTYRASVSADRHAQDFAVTVYAPPGVALERVRESVRFPATRYCMRNFGSSTVRWETAGDPDAWRYSRVDDRRLQFEGRCRAR